MLLLPFDEVGRRLGGLNERTVRRLVAAGRLAAVTVTGRIRRVHVDELDRFARSLAAGAGA